MAYSFLAFQHGDFVEYDWTGCRGTFYELFLELRVGESYLTSKGCAAEPLRVAGKCPFLLAGRGTLTKTFPFREAPAFGPGASIGYPLGLRYGRLQVPRHCSTICFVLEEKMVLN